MNAKLVTVEFNEEAQVMLFRIDVAGFGYKEYSLWVNLHTYMVTGDVVAHGDWYDIEQEECLEVLKAGVPEAIYKWITDGKKRFLNGGILEVMDNE